MIHNKLLSLPLAIIATIGVAGAEVPSVAVDIAPAHSLVSLVMEGVGAPDLLVPLGASPHSYSMRPLEAKALQDADLVFWVSGTLTPWLDGSINTLVADAKTVELMTVPGTVELALREGALFEAHEHEHGEHDDDGEEAEEEHSEHEGRSTNGGSHDDHAEDSLDPHAWLAPDNAKTWLGTIAAELSKIDPENGEAYVKNAAAAKTELDRLVEEINADLEPLRGRHFIVFHDAYQYFETSFDFFAAGAISLSDAAKPSPARIEEIRNRVADGNVTCVLAEPQFNPDLVKTVLDETRINSGVLDPLGSDLAAGPALYSQLLRNLSRTLTECLAR